MLLYHDLGPDAASEADDAAGREAALDAFVALVWASGVLVVALLSLSLAYFLRKLPPDDDAAGGGAAEAARAARDDDDARVALDARQAELDAHLAWLTTGGAEEGERGDARRDERGGAGGVAAREIELAGGRLDAHR